MEFKGKWRIAVLTHCRHVCPKLFVDNICSFQSSRPNCESIQQIFGQKSWVSINNGQQKMKWKSLFGVNATLMIMADDTTPLVLFLALPCTYVFRPRHTQKLRKSSIRMFTSWIQYRLKIGILRIACSLSHTTHATVSDSRPRSTHLLRDMVLSLHTLARLDACNERRALPHV